MAAKKKFTKPLEAKKGAEGIKKLVNNHKKCIDEIQEELESEDEEEDELTVDFIGVKDARIVTWQIRALQTNVEIITQEPP